jgi:hypothetical protein
METAGELMNPAGDSPSCRREDDEGCYCWSTENWGSYCIPDSRSLKAKILIRVLAVGWLPTGLRGKSCHFCTHELTVKRFDTGACHLNFEMAAARSFFDIA